MSFRHRGFGKGDGDPAGYGADGTKLHVAEGDNVKQGDVLFQYDSEELQLSLDKQNLELEQLKNTSTTLRVRLQPCRRSKKTPPRTNS